MEGTNALLEGPGIVLKLDQSSNVKNCPQLGEELAGFPITRGQVLQASWLLKPRFLHPIEWKPIQQGEVMRATTYLKELLPKAFVRLLKES